MAHDNHIENWFNQNITRYQQQSQEQQRKSNLISTIRMVVFLLFITLSGMCFYQNWWSLLTLSLITFGFLFGYLVNTHNSVKAKRKHYDLLVGINQDELKRLSLDLKGFASGLEYSIRDHPYCVDLDLFGGHSLFQWLNRTVTNGGAKLLAQSLLNTSSTRNNLAAATSSKRVIRKSGLEPTLSGRWTGVQEKCSSGGFVPGLGNDTHRTAKMVKAGFVHTSSSGNWANCCLFYGYLAGILGVCGAGY